MNTPKTVTQLIREKIDAVTGDRDTEYPWLIAQCERVFGWGAQEIASENKERIEKGLKPVIKGEREGD